MDFLLLFDLKLLSFFLFGPRESAARLREKPENNPEADWL